MFNCRSPPPRASVSPPPPRGRRSRSPSRSRRSRSRSRDSVDASNPGNNLYVTGLSTRVTSSDLEKFFGKEGKVVNCNLVCDPRSKESRGFAFVTMESKDDADRCIKYLNRSVLEGRLVTVEKGVVIGAPEATRHVDVNAETENLTQGMCPGEADPVLHLVKGEMIRTHTEGTRNLLCQLTAAATVGRNRDIMKEERKPYVTSMTSFFW
ncbi:Serine/arginine-rich splicing factor SR45a [Linum grandiflorum]